MSNAASTPLHPISDLQWWGVQSFEIGQSRRWQLGALWLSITRDLYEWRLEYHRPKRLSEHKIGSHSLLWRVLQQHETLPEPSKLERYLFANTDATLTLLPRLADRSMVVKPINPIFIPAGQQGQLYVSTPLWLTAVAHDQDEPLFDLPIIRPNDTWFGPDTLKGEICYATPVFGRTELAHLPVSGLWAVTPIHFRNRSSRQLQLDRMNLPVDALPLFQSLENGQLWTSEIEVIQESHLRPPKVRIHQHTPQPAGRVRFINPPRNSEGSFFRMFDSFF